MRAFRQVRRVNAYALASPHLPSDLCPNRRRRRQSSCAGALALAASSVALASPNPQVGCVLVRDGHILGEGAHLYDLCDHAEIAALKSCTVSPRGATAYVTLEPCSHHGRTGPCADALIAAGIARAVVATQDPNPQVSGRGLARLRAAGIEIRLGVCEAEARALNDAFALSITRGRPFVTLKSAISTDGFLAPAPALRAENAPVFLTGPAARQDVQHLRHASDALLTGIGTVLADDPLLTDRTLLPRRRPLLRVLLDSHLRIPLSARLLHPVQDDLWIFCAPQSSLDRTNALLDLGIHVIPVPHNPQTGLDLEAVLRHLHQAHILSILLEAGSALNGAFLNSETCRPCHPLLRPHRARTRLHPLRPRRLPAPSPSSKRLQHLEKQPLGPDVRVTGLLHNPWPH